MQERRKTQARIQARMLTDMGSPRQLFRHEGVRNGQRRLRDETKLADKVSQRKRNSDRMHEQIRVRISTFKNSAAHPYRPQLANAACVSDELQTSFWKRAGTKDQID